MKTSEVECPDFNWHQVFSLIRFCVDIETADENLLYLESN